MAAWQLMFVAVLIVSACGRHPSTSAEAASSAAAAPAPARGASASAPVRVSFRNVHLRVAHGAVLEVRRLEGALISTRAGKPPVFDDQGSFRMRIDAAEIAISPASLTRVLNGHVFAFEGSPLTDIEVSIEDGHLKQKGTLHKGVAVPFSTVADISASSDGRVRLRALEMKAAGIPSTSLLKMLGLELDDLVKSHPPRGFEIVDNDVLLSPDRLLPEPAMEGHLTSVRLERDRIVEVFGPQPRNRRADVGAGNYMHYRGGVLRFGRLTMDDTDMRLIDADPKDAFDFYPERYVRQLVAGYSKNTPDGALRVYMPDYNEVAEADLRPLR